MSKDHPYLENFKDNLTIALNADYQTMAVDVDLLAWLLSDRDEKIRALELADRTFREYAWVHSQKYTPIAHAKATANEKLAEAMRAAIGESENA